MAQLVSTNRIIFGERSYSIGTEVPLIREAVTPLLGQIVVVQLLNFKGKPLTVRQERFSRPAITDLTYDYVGQIDRLAKRHASRSTGDPYDLIIGTLTALHTKDLSRTKPEQVQSLYTVVQDENDERWLIPLSEDPDAKIGTHVMHLLVPCEYTARHAAQEE